MRVRCSLMFLQAAIYCVVVFLLRNTRHVTFTNVLYLFFAPLTSRGRSLQLAFVFYLRVEVPIGCLWLWTNDYVLLRDSYLSPCCPSRIVGRGCFFVRVKKETRLPSAFSYHRRPLWLLFLRYNLSSETAINCTIRYFRVISTSLVLSHTSYLLQI